MSILSQLKRSIRGADSATSDVLGVPTPRLETVVVGDIHGRADLLRDLLEKIDQIAPEATRVFVGDYIDRGPDSRGVLDIMIEEVEAGSFCLMGNHEAMCLEFLSQEYTNGFHWLRHGGLATLASFGIEVSRDASFGEIAEAKMRFSERVGEATITWLKNRPLYWKSGNLWVCHAGPDPSEPISTQDEEHFLWGHERFLRDARNDGQWVAHGHWVTDEPTVASSRISVDTGAWSTGVLTAAVISTGGDIEFLTA